MSRNATNPFAILSAKGATGVGNTMLVKDFKHIIVAVTATLNSSLTFKFQGSLGTSATSGDAPVFSDAQAVANHWDYVAAYDLQTPGTVITGDTGVAINNDTVANNTHLYLVNVDGLTWFNMSVTSFTDGALTAFAVGYSNE